MPESVETPAPVSTETRRPDNSSTVWSMPLTSSGGRSVVTTATGTSSRSSQQCKRVSFRNCFRGLAIWEGAVTRGTDQKGGAVRIHRVNDLQAEGLADYSRLTDVALRRVSEPEGGLYIAESTKVIR